MSLRATHRPPVRRESAVPACPRCCFPSSSRSPASSASPGRPACARPTWLPRSARTRSERPAPTPAGARAPRPRATRSEPAVGSARARDGAGPERALRERRRASGPSARAAQTGRRTAVRRTAVRTPPVAVANRVPPTAISTTTVAVAAAAAAAAVAGTATATSADNRGNRGNRFDSEPEIAEDDVLLPVAGILDILDSYAFVRTSGYLPGSNDVYLSLSMVRTLRAAQGRRRHRCRTPAPGGREAAEVQPDGPRRHDQRRRPGGGT